VGLYSVKLWYIEIISKNKNMSLDWLVKNKKTKKQKTLITIKTIHANEKDIRDVKKQRGVDIS
jgi:hypothetical protein